MTRLSNWEAGLADYIASVRTLAYQYGRHDCGLFFAGAVIAITGSDPAAPFRGKYSTEMGAAMALAKYGAGDLEATLDDLFESTPVGFVRRGDGVWDGSAVGVSMGGYALFVGRVETVDGAGAQEGLIRVPRADWIKGWRVE